MFSPSRLCALSLLAILATDARADVPPPPTWITTVRLGLMPVVQQAGSTLTIPIHLTFQSRYWGFDGGRDSFASTETLDLLFSGIYRAGIRLQYPGKRVRPYAYGRFGMIWGFTDVTPVILNGGLVVTWGIGLDVGSSRGGLFFEIGALRGLDNPPGATFAIGLAL